MKRRTAAALNSASARRGLAMRRAGGHLSARAGFTVAELVIVVLLIGFLFSMMFGVIFGLTQVTTMSSPSSTAKAAGFLALENIRSSIDQTYFQRDIRRLVFLAKTTGKGDRRRDQVTFACVHPNADSLGVPAVREVSFYLEEDKADTGDVKTYVLMRREDEMVDDKPGEGGNHYPLVRGVLALKMRYSLNGKDWKDDWDSTRRRRIPRMVQIQLRIQAGNRSIRFETMAQPGLYIR
ncbi:MAG: type II secretion system protein GspJ [bacterium]|nr:type II secretion system protein GspJ [bacterium]